MAETLAELQAALETISAERAEWQLRIRRRELIEVANLERLTIERGHGVRDFLMLIMPARQAAPLAAAHGLDPGLALTVLSSTMRAALFEIAKGPRPGERA